jgi:hypothetical protein
MVKAIAIVIAIASGAAGVVRADALHLRLITPPTLRGDGSTATLRLEATPADAAAELSAVSLDVDAGRVGKTTPVDGGFAIEYTPPQVAVDRDVHLAVVVGGSVVSAPVTVRIAAAGRAAATQSSSGLLALTAPASLLLGADASAIVSGAGPRPLSFAVNVGVLEAPALGKDGRWRVVYTPPAQKFPQVAIVAAGDGAGRVDWLRIPLSGVGRVETRTKARAQITLSIADATFGPFRTDASGVATTPVVAPPGVHRGTTHTVDPLGNASDLPFDLGTPPFSRLLAACDGDTVHLFVVDAAGAPSTADEKLMLRASRGTLAEATRAADGHYVARWTPGDADDAEVGASLAGEPRWTSTCKLRRADDPPVAIALTVDRQSFVAGSGALVAHAELRGAGTRPPRAVAMTLESDDGAVEDVVVEGRALHARWRLPNELGGRATATLRARTQDPPLSAEVKIALVPGPIARLDIERPRARLAAADRARLAVRAADEWGNPAPTDQLVARAHGERIAVAPAGAGRAAIDYVAPSSERGGEERVTVADPASGQSSAIVVRLAAAPRAVAVAARLGWLTNFGKISAPLVLVDGAWRPRWLRRRLSLGVEAGFYDSTNQTADVATGSSVAFGVIGVPLALRVGYAHPLGRVSLFAGVAGGVDIVRLSATSAALVKDSSTMALGLFAVHAGADFDVRFGRLLVEASFFYAPGNDGAVSGNFGGLGLLAGYRVEL